MSAITGIFYRNGRNVDPELIKKMNNRLSHRGPDGSAVYCEGPIALGQQMLWTTPESLHEKLPFHDEKSGLVITADARIDNRKELSTKLVIEDKEDVADSYFILKAYEKWGEKCPEHLLGDFTFAIWDEDEEKLFCARDHMGVKPFYYFLNDEMFIFGTEIKAILATSLIHKKINEEKLALFLMRDIMDGELTFYEDIKSLQAAHFLIISRYKAVIDRYWTLNPNLQIRMDSDKEYETKFLEIFTEAVQCRLRSNYLIGFELSGGLDSSSIVCIAKKLLVEQDIDLESINTFSNVFDEIPESDEKYYINEVLGNAKINPYFFKGDDISPLENINEILWHQDQPFFSPNTANQVKSYEKMSHKGIRVLLSGEGGDQIISHGGNYIRELFLTFDYKKLVEEINGQAQNFNQSKFCILISELIFPSIPFSIKKLIGSIRKKNKDSILNKNLIKELGIEEVNIDYILDGLGKVKTKEHHYFSIYNPLTQTVFGIMDRNTAIFNIEGRYPFFDKRLVEFCYSLPTDMKIKDGWGRYIMRIAMEDILPPEIQWRQKKADLSYVYKRNLILFEKKALKKIIYSDNDEIKKYVDLNIIQEIFKKYESGKKENLFEFWLVIVIYFWLNEIKK